LRIAWLAKARKFDYWLDALDRFLLPLKNRKLSPAQEAVAPAMTIEMGLLNCCHDAAIAWNTVDSLRIWQGESRSPNIHSGRLLVPSAPRHERFGRVLVARKTNADDIQQRLPEELSRWSTDYGR